MRIFTTIVTLIGLSIIAGIGYFVFLVSHIPREAETVGFVHIPSIEVSTLDPTDNTPIVLAEAENEEEDDPWSRKVILGTGDLEDPCVVEVHEAVLPELKKAGIEKWLAACQEAVKNGA